MMLQQEKKINNYKYKPLADFKLFKFNFVF